MVLAGVVALVVAGVIALAVATTMRNAATAAPSVDQEALGSATLPAMPAGDVAIEPEGRIYFELGSDAMPAAAAEVLGKVADAARTQAEKESARRHGLRADRRIDCRRHAVRHLNPWITMVLRMI
jgi:hypothetical protein